MWIYPRREEVPPLPDKEFTLSSPWEEKKESRRVSQIECLNAWLFDLFDPLLAPMNNSRNDPMNKTYISRISFVNTINDEQKQMSISGYRRLPRPKLTWLVWHPSHVKMVLLTEVFIQTPWTLTITWSGVTKGSPPNPQHYRTSQLVGHLFIPRRWYQLTR